MQSVNTDNWSFCRYEKENFLAQITFGADPESRLEYPLGNYVTVLQDEETEIFQKKFMTLTEACLYLNANYRDWNFLDQTATKSGCSTCAAH
jgi:hypothetical protein